MLKNIFIASFLPVQRESASTPGATEKMDLRRIGEVLPRIVRTQLLNEPECKSMVGTGSDKSDVIVAVVLFIPVENVSFGAVTRVKDRPFFRAVKDDRPPRFVSRCKPKRTFVTGLSRRRTQRSVYFVLRCLYGFVLSRRFGTILSCGRSTTGRRHYDEHPC